jgi:hypothetical protein
MVAAGAPSQAILPAELHLFDVAKGGTTNIIAILPLSGGAFRPQL